MSIKKKKHVIQSRNSYRWKHVDDFLTLKGYICRDLTKDLRVWVDCVGNGRDIQYTCHNLESIDARFRGNPKAEYLEPVFDVMCTHSGTGNQVLQSFPTLRGAIHCSRDNPRWHA